MTGGTGPGNEEAAASLSSALADDNAGLLKSLAVHRWVSALADGTLPQAALTAWARQRALFCLMERPAVHRVRSLTRPGNLDRLLARLAEDTEREARELGDLLARVGAAPAAEPWPDCLGYGSYVQASAARGLLEGLTAITAVKRACLDTWTSLLPGSPEGSPCMHWIRHWSGDDFRDVVTGLEGCLDQLAGPPAPQLLELLSPVYHAVLQWEYNFWDMAWTGKGWAAVQGTGREPLPESWRLRTEPGPEVTTAPGNRSR